MELGKFGYSPRHFVDPNSDFINKLMTSYQEITNDYETKPFTIGGGIGESRVLMLLLGKEHIAEIQASAWEDKTYLELEGKCIL